MVGNETKVKVVKNKVAPPFKQVMFDILYGEGISREGEIIDLGVAQNVIDKSGAWYSYDGNRIGQGKDNVRNLLKENPDLAAEIEAKIRAILLPKPEAKPEAKPDLKPDSKPAPKAESKPGRTGPAAESPPESAAPPAEAKP